MKKNKSRLDGESCGQVATRQAGREGVSGEVIFEQKPECFTGETVQRSTAAFLRLAYQADLVLKSFL